MQLHISIWGIVLAAISSMIIGAIYYSDGVFGKQWKKLAKIDTKKFDKEMGWSMVQVFIGALISAYTIAFVTSLYRSFYHSNWIASGFASSLLLFVGISATTIVIHDTLNQKPTKLINITLGNRLVSLVVMGLIIGWIHP
jgi:hypothetical protein